VILLLLQSAQSEECKLELEQRTREPVILCPTVRDALVALRRDSCSAIVLDQNLLEMNSPQTDALIRSTGTATAVFFSSGVWNMDRVCKETELALERATHEKYKARETAKHELKEQLSGAVTGILLSSELALKTNSLPPLVEETLRSIRDLAAEMRDCLQ